MRNYLNRISLAVFSPQKAIWAISPLEAKFEDAIPFIILAGFFKARPYAYQAIATIPSGPLVGSMQLLQVIVSGFFPGLVLLLLLAAFLKLFSKAKISWEQALAGAGYAYLGYAALVFIGALLNRFDIYSPYLASSEIGSGAGNVILQIIAHFSLFFIYGAIFFITLPKKPQEPGNNKAPLWALSAAIVIFAALPLASVAADGYYITKHYDEIRPLGRNDAAAEFALKDTNGATVKLSDFSGKVVFIDFFATWCNVCERMEPTIADIYKKYRENGLVVLAINTETEDEPEYLRKYVQKRGIEYPVLQKTPKSLREYRIRTLPTFLLVGKEGRVEEAFMGLVSGATLEEAIEKELEEK